MFVIGEVKVLDENEITIQRQWPFRTVKSQYKFKSNLSLKVGDFVRGLDDGDELTDIEQIIVDTCSRCGAQFELMSAQYLEYPIPGCCSHIATPIKVQVQLKEIYHKGDQYRLWLATDNVNFLTKWIGCYDFLSGEDEHLKIGEQYSITAWQDSEHEYLQEIFMDVIRLVDIYK